MSSPLDYLELCRLCLVKDRVQVPIFEDDGDVNQIFLKIHACLPVKVSRDDKLPRKICSDCSYKLELFYQFWNTTANAEKQLLQWLGEDDGLDDKQQGYVTEVLDPNVMKQEGNSDSRLDNSVMQVSGHQNMDINMIENMSIITMPAGSDQQFTTVPMGTRGTVQTVQVPGPSTQTAHDQTGVAHLQEVEVDQEDEDNMDDGCDNDDGLPVKEETDEGDRSLEQSYVSLPCDEAGPSGLQQQKISEMSEITIQQTADGDHKTGLDDSSSGTTMALYEVKYVEDEATYTFVPIADEAAQQAASTAESCQELEKCTCDECDLQCTSEVRLEWHRSAHESLKNYKVNKKQARKDKTTSATSDVASCSSSNEKLKFICPTCEFSTCERQLMIDHFTAKHCAMMTAELKSVNEQQQQQQQQQSAEDEEVEELELTEMTCGQCGFSSYVQDDLDFHSCRKPGEEASSSFSCHLCTYECFTRTGLQSHITRKHKPNPGSEVPARYACDECDYKCANKSTLYSHKRKHRPKSNPKQLKMKSSKIKPSAVKLQQQQQRKEQKEEEEEEEKEKEEEEDEEEEEKEEKEEIGSSSSSSGGDGGGRRRPQCTYFCNECDYSTAKKNALFQHIKKAAGHSKQSGSRNKDRLFSCDQCPYTNKNRYELKVHVIRKHSNEYNYECEQCGKKYKIKGDLTNHIRFQHREQPIICDVCGKTCGNSNSLYVHQKFAHYKAEFECHICHRRMVSQANLDEHVLKQHEQRQDAICEECGKTFTRQSRLKIHMRIHLGIKPHDCKLCGKAFSRKTALRQHLLIHTGQRPYLCDICGKSFTQKPGLISHRKSHPGTHPPLPRVTIDHVLSDLLTAQADT
ncbi:zinc finger protein 665-like isoform X4 [Phymastichus coffea]|uniref:zinc finger protein 665-like isoform X4 n=1 Tax=Phymastichus coffea TaxID=108790 RepID=UPI00273A903E|nr:zinc finger protein 665-like isoform X4 [Phymastichus coffea]